MSMSNVNWRVGVGRYGRALEERLQERSREIAHNQMLRQAELYEGIAPHMQSLGGEPEPLQQRHSSPTIPEGQVRQPFPEQHFEQSTFPGTTETEAVSRHMSLQERVLYYAIFIIHFGLSEEEIKRTEDLMEVLYGRPPPVSYKAHIRQLYGNVLNEFERKRYFFCSACGNPLREWRNLCENVGCALYRVYIKRAKSVQRTELHVISIVPQLTDLISSQIEKIISFHGMLHHSEADGNRSDIRLFPGFREAIETANEFCAHRLRILLSLSVDGFIPKRLSCREIWPLYLRLENVPRAEGDNFHNSLLAGILCTPVKPTDLMMETLFSRLESEISALHDTPMEVNINGIVWTLEVSLYRGIADMAAQKILYGVPTWNRSYGCSKCDLKGLVQGRQRIWLPAPGEITSLRSPESFARDAQNYGQFGISQMTPAMRVMLPCAFSSDSLHICSEGVTRDRLRDMFNAASRFPDLRIDYHNTELLKTCLRELSSHTYANSIILSLEDLKTCKAAEIDELAFVIFPLVVAGGMISSPVAATSILGYWFCLRTMAQCKSLNVDIIRIAQSVARGTRHIWSELAPEVFTMKCHWFFDHGMMEELEKYGSLYQWSSAPFEGFHRRLQIKINQSTSNSSVLMIERYLLSKKVRNIFFDHCQGNPLMMSLKANIENRHRRRFPIGIPVEDGIYIPKGCKIEEGCLLQEHRTRITQTHEQPFSRLFIGGKVYSSRIYWKAPRATRQDVIHLYGREGDEDLDHFGSILLFLYNRMTRSVRVLVEEFTSVDPFTHLSNLVNHNPHPCRRTALELLRLISENNTFFRELSGKRVRVRPVRLISGPATLADLANRSYASCS